MVKCNTVLRAIISMNTVLLVLLWSAPLVDPLVLQCH